MQTLMYIAHLQCLARLVDERAYTCSAQVSQTHA
jgi:hypothetical protein